MVCNFGLGPEGISWVAATGAAGLKRLHLHQAVSDANNVVPWWNSSESRTMRHKDTSPTAFKDQEDSFPTAFAESKGKKDEKKEEGSGCFPAVATMYVKSRGPVRVVDLQAGDLVLCGNADSSSLSFSPFIGHLHYEPAAVEDYLVIETSMDAKVGSPLMLSGEHLIFVAGSRDSRAIAVRASDVRVGDWLCRASCDGDLQRTQIVNVSMTQLEGRFCPLTEAGTVIVESALCSCYVDPFVENAPSWLRGLAATQEVAHTVLLPLRLAAKLGSPMQDARDAEEDAGSRKGLHPYLRKLMALPAVGKVI